jgi:hypothetical protein
MPRQLVGLVDRKGSKFRARLGALYLGVFDSERDAWDAIADAKATPFASWPESGSRRASSEARSRRLRSSKATGATASRSTPSSSTGPSGECARCTFKRCSRGSQSSRRTR